MKKIAPMPDATVARGAMSPVTYQYGLSCFSHRDTEELLKGRRK